MAQMPAELVLMVIVCRQLSVDAKLQPASHASKLCACSRTTLEHLQLFSSRWPPGTALQCATLLQSKTISP